MLRIIIWVQKELLYHKHEDIKKDYQPSFIRTPTANMKKKIPTWFMTSPEISRPGQTSIQGPRQRRLTYLQQTTISVEKKIPYHPSPT